MTVFKNLLFLLPFIIFPNGIYGAPNKTLTICEINSQLHLLAKLDLRVHAHNSQASTLSPHERAQQARINHSVYTYKILDVSQRLGVKGREYLIRRLKGFCSESNSSQVSVIIRILAASGVEKPMILKHIPFAFYADKKNLIFLSIKEGEYIHRFGDKLYKSFHINPSSNGGGK